MLTLATALVVGLAPSSHVLAQPATAFAATINGEAQPPERGHSMWRFGSRWNGAGQKPEGFVTSLPALRGHVVHTGLRMG